MQPIWNVMLTRLVRARDLDFLAARVEQLDLRAQALDLRAARRLGSTTTSVESPVTSSSACHGDTLFDVLEAPLPRIR